MIQRTNHLNLDQKIGLKYMMNYEEYIMYNDDESNINDDNNNKIKFKTSMIRSSLCDYSNAYILFKVTITVLDISAVNNANKKVVFKNCAPFTSCITEINKTQVDNAEDIDNAYAQFNRIS